MRPRLLRARIVSLFSLFLVLVISSARGQPVVVQIFNPNWNITLTDAGYSDWLYDNTPGFEGREYLSSAWWMPFFPGAALTLSSLGFNLLGDGLRDILSRQR